MKTKLLIISILMLTTLSCFSQRFELFEKITPSGSKFKLLGISSDTNVYTYKYIGIITDKYLFGRKVGEILVGLKNNVVVTTVYNLIPEKQDEDVPQETIDLLQSTLDFPLTKLSDYYAVKIDNYNITISRTNSAVTFHKDRIMFFKSVKQRFLRN